MTNNGGAYFTSTIISLIFSLVMTEDRSYDSCQIIFDKLFCEVEQRKEGGRLNLEQVIYVKRSKGHLN